MIKTISDYLQSRSSSEPNLLMQQTHTSEEAGEYSTPDYQTLGSIGFQIFGKLLDKNNPKDTDQVMLIKPKYRRRNDYDLWIDVYSGRFYVSDPNNVYYLNEIQGITKDYVARYNHNYSIREGIPKDSFEFITDKYKFYTEHNLI